MKLQFKKRRLLPVALAILVLVVGSGVAYAYWTTTGGGTGAAAAASGVTGVDIAQSTAPEDALIAMYPGDSPQIIRVTISNNTTQSVHVMSVSASVTSTSAGNVCLPDNFTVVTPALLGALDAGVEIPVSGSVTVNGPTIQFNNKASLQDACKGVTVNLAFSAS